MCYRLKAIFLPRYYYRVIRFDSVSVDNEKLFDRFVYKLIVPFSERVLAGPSECSPGKLSAPQCRTQCFNYRSVSWLRRRDDSCGRR